MSVLSSWLCDGITMRPIPDAILMLLPIEATMQVYEFAQTFVFHQN
jgi:hypothetical protein